MKRSALLVFDWAHRSQWERAINGAGLLEDDRKTLWGFTAAVQMISRIGRVRPSLRTLWDEMQQRMVAAVAAPNGTPEQELRAFLQWAEDCRRVSGSSLAPSTLLKACRTTGARFPTTASPTTTTPILRWRSTRACSSRSRRSTRSVQTLMYPASRVPFPCI